MYIMCDTRQMLLMHDDSEADFYSCQKVHDLNVAKGVDHRKKVRFLWTLSVGGGGGSTPFYSFWGCFFLTSQKLFVDENSTKSQNYPPKMINLSPKFIISPVYYKFPQKC